MQRNGVRSLVSFITSLYPNSPQMRTGQRLFQLQNILECYVTGTLSFEDCSETSRQLTGTSQPVERLSEILNVARQPMPQQAPALSPDESDREDGVRRKSRSWTTQEDDRLLAGIFRFGPDNWTSIARFVGNSRSRSQCSQRWQRGLDPRLSKMQWSITEEAKLLQLVSTFGDRNWTQIASKMGNRSDVQCRYRYKQMMKDRTGHTRAMMAAYGGGMMVQPQQLRRARSNMRFDLTPSVSGPLQVDQRTLWPNASMANMLVGRLQVPEVAHPPRKQRRAATPTQSPPSPEARPPAPERPVDDIFRSDEMFDFSDTGDDSWFDEKPVAKPEAALFTGPGAHEGMCEDMYSLY